MKAIGLGVGLLFIGLIIGFFIGKKNNQSINDTAITVLQIDTVVKSEIIEVPIEIKKTIVKTDTVYLSRSVVGDSSIIKNDTTGPIGEHIYTSALSKDTLEIVSDEKIKTIQIKIDYLFEQEKDTLLEKLLDVNPISITYLQIEFWKSPINYNGYKLSKTKLIIFGILPSESIRFINNESNYYLLNNDVYYELYETNVFKKLQIVPNPIK